MGQTQSSGPLLPPPPPSSRASNSGSSNVTRKAATATAQATKNGSSRAPPASKTAKRSGGAVRLSPARQESFKNCTDKEMNDYRAVYGLSKVGYERSMDEREIEGLARYLVEYHKMEFEDMGDVLYPDTFWKASDILCRWMRPEEMFRLGEKLLGRELDEDEATYHTGIMMIETENPKSFGSVVGKEGENFKKLTSDYDLMFVWMHAEDPNSTRRVVVLYGRESEPIKNAMHAIVERNAAVKVSEEYPEGYILVGQSLENNGFVMGTETDFEEIYALDDKSKLLSVNLSQDEGEEEFHAEDQVGFLEDGGPGYDRFGNFGSGEGFSSNRGYVEDPDTGYLVFGWLNEDGTLKETIDDKRGARGGSGRKVAGRKAANRKAAKK